MPEPRAGARRAAKDASLVLASRGATGTTVIAGTRVDMKCDSGVNVSNEDVRVLETKTSARVGNHKRSLKRQHALYRRGAGKIAHKTGSERGTERAEANVRQPDSRPGIRPLPVPNRHLRKPSPLRD